MFSYLVEVIFACFSQILFLGILDVPLCTCLPSSPLLFLFLEFKKKKSSKGVTTSRSTQLCTKLLLGCSQNLQESFPFCIVILLFNLLKSLLSDVLLQ